MTKSAAEVEAEVEATRSDLDRTVEALKDKMHPGQLFDEATRMMSGTSNQVLTKVVEQARTNPLPLAVIGLGVAWLAFNQTRRTSYADTYSAYDSYDDDGAQPSLKSRLTGRVSDARHQVTDRVELARDRVSDGVSAAKGKVGGLVDRAKVGLHDARETAEEKARMAQQRLSTLGADVSERAGQVRVQARQRYEDTLETEPLILAAIGVAVGAAVGAAMPASPVERRYVGPTRDRLLEKGKTLAADSLEDAKGIAARAYDQAKEELKRQTGPDGKGSTLTEKAQAVANAGAATVKEELHGRLPN